MNLFKTKLELPSDDESKADFYEGSVASSVPKFHGTQLLLTFSFDQI